MGDPFLHLFSWLTPVLRQAAFDDLPLQEKERALLEEFRQGWGRMDTAELLRGISRRYGDMAPAVIERVISRRISDDWADIGRREAHEGREIDDFIDLLWEPLRAEGFVFAYEKKGSDVVFRVTQCPIHDLAERTGLHRWLYHLACATDFYTACAFSPRIDFRRTKTLMEGHDCCDHTYSYRATGA